MSSYSGVKLMCRICDLMSLKIGYSIWFFFS